MDLTVSHMAGCCMHNQRIEKVGGICSWDEPLFLQSVPLYGQVNSTVCITLCLPTQNRQESSDVSRGI